jgi:hypothetical protein
MIELLSRNVFYFLKYNTIQQVEKLSEIDEQLYQQFILKVQLLQEQLESNNDKASATLSSLCTIFGFSRHFCEITGKPIIGKYYRLNGKTVSKDAFDSYKIFNEIEKKEKKDNK